MSELDKYVGQYEMWPNVETMRLAVLAQLVMKQVIREEIPATDIKAFNQGGESNE